MNITQYRAAIGRWHLFTLSRPKKIKNKFKYKLGESLLNYILKIKPLLILLLIILSKFLLQCGDIEQNPGPVRSLLINHINAHSLCPSDRSKRLDEIYSTLCIKEAIDVICVSETWLHPGIPDDDILLPDYQLLRKDRLVGPDDGIGGGVAMYRYI